MRVFITGATGFIGSTLTRRLVRLGWKVNVLVRNKKKLGRLSGVKGIKIYQGDLGNAKILLEGARGSEIIFNCAAALPYHNLSIKDYKKTNVKGLENILKTVRSIKARLVHLSTVGIYGSAQFGEVDENSNINPRDVYAVTKVEGEKLIREYEKKYKIEAVIIRPTIAYGPSDTRPGFLNLFKLIKSGLFIPVGNGENYFHTVYVENLIDALVLVAKNKKVIGEDFIIGDDPCPKMREIYKSQYALSGRKFPKIYLPVVVASVIGRFFDLVSALGFPNILGTKRVKFLTENKRYKIDKAKRMLKYNPKVGLKEGLEITYHWYSQNGYLNK